LFDSPFNRYAASAARRTEALHKWHWQTVYDFHRWHRWWRKQPENRRGPEPKFCPAFVADRPWHKRATFHGVAGFKVYPKTLVDHGVVALYHAARAPQAEPVAPLSPETCQQIESLYLEVARYFMV
jgi:hypothetical protein